MRPEPCLLCGAEASETKRELVRWLESAPGHEYDTLPRCVDRVACRARVRWRGERWEVADGTPARQPEAPTRGAEPTVPVPAEPAHEPSTQAEGAAAPDEDLAAVFG